MNDVINNMEIKCKTGRKKSGIRNFYDKKNDKLYCNINNCTKNFSSKSSIYSLRDHINQCHDMCKNIKNNNTTNIIMTELKDKEYKIYKAFALAFAKNSLSHRLIEDNYFQSAIKLLNDDIKITKLKLRETIIIEGEKTNNQIIEMLFINNQPITMAVDGWTNIKADKITNILLIASGIPYYYKSIVNKKDFNKVDWLVPKIQEIINFLIKKGLNIIAITTDNENLMKAVCKKLKVLFPVLINIPCSAHIMQLCLKKICNNDKIKMIINKMMENIIY